MLGIVYFLVGWILFGGIKWELNKIYFGLSFFKEKVWCYMYIYNVSWDFIKIDWGILIKIF